MIFLSLINPEYHASRKTKKFAERHWIKFVEDQDCDYPSLQISLFFFCFFPKSPFFNSLRSSISIFQNQTARDIRWDLLKEKTNKVNTESRDRERKKKRLSVWFSSFGSKVRIHTVCRSTQTFNRITFYQNK
jgi:hypothetical protein